MKYYAVTEDPRELFHYGVKGMKWGKHLFGDDLRPKSTGYKRALSKLRSAAQKTVVATGKVARTTAKAAKATGGFLKRSAIQTSYAVRQAQDNKYNRAVQRAQKRMNLSSAMRSLDRDSSVYRQENLDHKREALLNKQYDIKAHNDYKQLKSSVHAERNMPKYMQQAREGTLRYGRLSEEQIGRIQQRLSWENQARNTGGREKPSWKEQKKQARREGYLQGITRGTGAAMEEVARAGVQIASKRLLDKQSSQRAEREKASNRIRNAKSRKDIREEIKEQAYEAQVREGVAAPKRWNATTASAAKDLQKLNIQRDDRNQARYIQNEITKDRALTESRNAYNDERQEKQFLEAAKSAYEYGYVPAYLLPNNGGGKKKGSKGNGNNNGQSQGNNNGQNKGNNANNQNKNPKSNKDDASNEDEVKALAKYYKKRYIKSETDKQKEFTSINPRQEENERRAQEIIEQRRKVEKEAQDIRDDLADLERRRREEIKRQKEAIRKQRQATREMQRGQRNANSGVNGRPITYIHK